MPFKGVFLVVLEAPYFVILFLRAFINDLRAFSRRIVDYTKERRKSLKTAKKGQRKEVWLIDILVQRDRQR